MDKKELSLIAEYHEKIINSDFEEKDIYSLLILLRPHSRRNSPLNEVSDFIAHREKDRGKIHRYLSRSRKEIIKATKKQAYNLTVKEVFSELELTASINEVFKKCDLEVINDKTGSAIMLCILSLLQDVKLREKNKTISSLVLSFPLDEENVTLFCNIPIPHISGVGLVYIKFAVLRTSYKPSNYPRQEEEKNIYKIVSENKTMHVQIVNNG